MKIELNDPLFLPHCGCEMSFSLLPGTGLLLVGENGIGKSTLLAAIHKILGPLHSAYLPQKELVFFSDRTLGKLKDIFLESMPRGLSLNTFEKLWTDFKLTSKENRYLSQLSGGEFQSLKICLTLSKDADYFLLDEPFQFLDQSRRDCLRQFLTELINQSKTVILVEHYRETFLQDWQTGEIYNDHGLLKLRHQWTT
jgi:ABC-type Mn2+/Zn2+ transport system ATPase subunit